MIGKCPAENCTEKVKIQKKLKKKKKKWDCLATLSFYVRYVIGKATFSQAKKILTLKLMISTYVRSLLFVKMETDTGLESLCSLLNLVPPMNKNGHQKLLLCAKDCYK